MITIEAKALFDRHCALTITFASGHSYTIYHEDAQDAKWMALEGASVDATTAVLEMMATFIEAGWKILPTE
jgi:hypothetical protein